MKDKHSTPSIKIIALFFVASAILFFIYFLSFYTKSKDSSTVNFSTTVSQPPIVLIDSLLPEAIVEVGTAGEDFVVPSGYRVKSAKAITNKGTSRIEGVFEGDFTNEGTLVLTGKIEGKLTNRGKIKFNSTNSQQ